MQTQDGAKVRRHVRLWSRTYPIPGGGGYAVVYWYTTVTDEWGNSTTELCGTGDVGEATARAAFRDLNRVA